MPLPWVDFNVKARLQNGLILQGGTSTGRQVTDACSVIVDNPSRRSCHVALPFQSQIKGLAVYTIPKIDVQLSATLQSNAGTQINANQVVPSAVVAQTLGRPLSGGQASVTINLLEPGQMYQGRVNETDLHIGKLLRFGRTRTNVGVDIFNMFNSDVVLTSNSTYGPAWLTPTLVMPARFAKVSVQFDF